MLQKFAAAAIGALIVVVPGAAFSAPAVVAIGQAQATLQVAPDPPQVGKNHFVVMLSGAPSDQIAKTSVTFGTVMPSMSMGGPSGAAKTTAAGRYEFDATLGMAASWDITIKLNGALTGTAAYHFSVGTSRSSAGSGTPAPAPNSGAMAAMAPAANADAWRTATFALVIILLGGMAAVIFARRERRPVAIVVTAGAAVLTLALAVIQARYAAPAMDMAAMSVVQGDAPVPVTLATVRGARDSSSVFAPGTVSPYLTQDIVTRAAGILRDFNSYAGERLRAGQVIATLEAPDLRSQAAAAVADAAAQASTARAAEIEAQHHAPNGVVIANAQTSAMQQDLAAARSDQAAKREQVRYWQNELRRESSLLREGAVSQQEYQDELAKGAAAQADYDASTKRIGSLQQQVLASRTKAMDAVASVRQMQEQASAARDAAARARANALTQTTVTGYLSVTVPSDGTVIKRLVDPGVYVAAGTPIARIAVIDRLRVQANVAQNDLAGITAGTPIDATLPDGSVVHGRVSAVSPVADPSTHTAPVEAIVRNTRTGIVPGGFVRVTLHARARRSGTSGGVLVPSAAVVGSGGTAAVWMSVNNVAQRVPVRVIADNGTFATVAGALPPGSRVVVEGAATLQDGQRLAGQS
ncbi:MAG: efflux RND transporter periplasmic adaptor subunit [Candidatus Velthaea sp.]